MSEWYASVIARAMASPSRELRLGWSEHLTNTAVGMDPHTAARIFAEALQQEPANWVHASFLASAVGRLEPAAFRARLESAEVLVACLERVTAPGFRPGPAGFLPMTSWDVTMASALETILDPLTPEDRTRLGDRAALALAAAIGRETDAGARDRWVKGLVSALSRLDPVRAGAIDSELVPGLIDDSVHASTILDRGSFATALASLSPWLDRPLLTRAVQAVAALLACESASATDIGSKNPLPACLARFADRMDVSEIVRILEATLEQGTWPSGSLLAFGDCLQELADRLGPAGEDRLYSRFAPRIAAGPW